MSHLSKKKVYVVEPRRIAAKAGAARVAEEMDFTVGKEIGYMTGDAAFAHLSQ
jgi:HrpA-like RNA helicase